MVTMRALLVLLLLAVPALAHAQRPGDPVDAPPAAKAPVWMWSIGGLMRITEHDPDADARIAALEEYGYTADTPTLTGLRGDLSWQRAPILDVGLAWAWAKGGYASGPTFEDPDQIDGSTLELGVFGRMHWVRPDFPVAPEPRVELGLARTSVDLRGASSQRIGTYMRLGLDVRLGAPKAGAMLSIDYTRVTGGGDDTMLDLPLGGVSVALSFYWRDWQAVPASPSASAPASR
jgi:hypothetical protein